MASWKGGGPAAELRNAAPLVLGAMWAGFLACYVVYDRFRHLKTADFFLYVGALVAVPVIGYSAFILARNVVLLPARRTALEAFILLFAAASTVFRGRIALAVLIVLFVAAALAVLRDRRVPGLVPPETPRPWVLARALAAIALGAGFLRLISANIATYLYWPYKDLPMVSWAMDIGEHKPVPARILAGAAGILATVYLGRLAWACVPRVRALGTWLQTRATLVWIVVAAVLGYSIVQAELYPNAHHHNAFLGARHLLLMGGWPLIDVFSQYGFAYFAFLPLGTVLPFNYQSAALVANLFDIAMMLVSVVMIRQLAGARRFAVPVAAAFFLVTWLVMPYNLSYTPSVFGVRWLPVWLLVLAFVSRPVSARLGIASLVLLNLCALWSLETHLVSSIISMFYCALAARLGGATLGRALLHAAKVVPLSLIGHALFVVTTFAVKGELPAYGTYLEIIGAYRASDNISWFLLAGEMILANVWLLFVVVYATLMFAALASFAAGRALMLEPRLLVGLSVLAAAGISQGLYFIGRPTHPLLALVALPLYTILACGFVYWLDHLARRPAGVWHEIALLASVAPAAFLGGIAVDRAMMALNSGKMGSTNATMLVKCLRFGACNPARELALIGRELRKPSSLSGDTPEAKAQKDAMVALYRKWKDRGPEIVSLAAQRTTAYIELGVRDRLPINNFYNDRLSPTLMARYAKSLETLPPGALIITIDDMSDYGIGLLCGLDRRFTFVPVDSIRETRVDRLVPRDERAGDGAGRALEQRDDVASVPVADGKLAPVKDGLAGYVERVVQDESSAMVSGWAIDEAASGVPSAVAITIRDRVWTTGVPRMERRDIAALNPRYLASGFRILVCDVTATDLATMRAFAVLADGSARELRYSAGVKHGPKQK